MADGRKIPYLIELGVTDEKLRQQMSKWDWESIMGGRGKGFGDTLISDAKEAKDEIRRTFGGLNIDWTKILGTKEVGQLEQAVTRALSKSRREIELFANSGDTTGIENTIKYVSALGDELKGLGSSFDAASLARGMGAFMKVLTPLTAKFEALADEPKKIEAAFDRLFSGVSASAKSVDIGKAFDVSGKIKVAMQGLKATNDEILEATESLEKYRNTVAKLSGDNPATIKLAQNLEGLNQQLDEQMRKEEQLAAQNKTNSAQYAATLKNIMAIENARLKMKAKPTTDYTGVEIREDFGYYEEQINKVVERISKKMAEAEDKLANTVDKSFAEIISKQISDIKLNLSIDKDNTNKLINEINQYVAEINRQPVIDNIKVGVKHTIDDSSNVIEDINKRAYGDNLEDDDAKTTELVNKTASRFDRIAQVIDDRQQSILTKTTDWRNSMINAMSIKSKDLEFQFGLESNMANTADALFNKLQEYFEQPEYALDIKFNTEKIARDLKASIEAEGIELGVGGGSANIDAKSLMSMLHSILYGGMPVHTPTQTGSTSGNSTQKEVANETDEATDSSKEYIKVLDETTLHIDKVIESLRVFAKEANKSNASNGSKQVASRLTNMGVDIGAIKNGASDTDIIKMLQVALMSKDEMGKAQGASLVGKLQSMMQTYKMDPKKGSGKVVDALAKDIMELFNINELETELEEELIRRFEQLEIWEGVKKPGKALAALGNVRSTKKKIRTPAMEQIDEAIKYFETAEEDAAPLQKLKEARKKFEDNGETDEAKKEFEKAALVFYDETKTVFNRLKDRWGDFKGVVQAEGRRPVTIDPKGAYPSRILEIPDNAVITKVDIFEVFKTIRDIGFTGSSARRESSQKKAEFEQQRITRNSHTPNYIVKKPTPKKDIRYEEIEYDTFKTQENLPPEVALDATIESLEKVAAEIPELVERIEESKKNITQLEEIKQQIENEISNLQVKDLPKFQMSAFEQYSKRDSSITEILRNAKSSLATNDVIDTGDVSKLDKEQQSLVSRLKTITTNIHNDSEASQEFADKIAEIVEAKKLSKEELEIARSKAAQRGDRVRVDLYGDLLFNRASVDNRLESYQSQKGTIDKNIGENKNYAQKLIKELEASQGQSADKATKEAETLATQLIEAKERLYAEAKTYANMLNDPSADDKTRETALGKLQKTLGGLNQITGKFATIQAYVPQTHLYSSSQQDNVDKWSKKYTNSEVEKLEKDLRGFEKQLKTEEDQTKVAELKKKIANTKRNLTRLKKSVPGNVSSKKQTELGNIERQLSEEQSKLIADESRKKAADKASSDLQSTKQDATFLTKYNELLEKEKSLLEEVNKLKREGADKSVIDSKTEELKQTTKTLDGFLKKEKNAERTAYARESAVEYQAQLQTAYRKRSVFDRRIQELDDEEANLTKYGLSGRIGSRALRKAKRKASDEYMASDDVKEQEKAILRNEKLSWEQRNAQLKELRQQLRKDFEDAFNDSNVQSDEEKRLAKLKKDIETERAPLDDIIKDLQSQKKVAMRYGAVSDDDLKNDKYLKQNEQYNKNILQLQSDRVKLERELESIKSDDSLDEKKQEKEIKSKQKAIDAINQEIQRNQALIDNRVKLMELHKQEKEESKQTPEEKALLATEKLVSMKQSLAQAEEKVATRKAEYESAKGTENEIKMLEALDNQIKKRDQIQEQIANTEKKIERLGQVTQKAEDVQDEVVSTVESAASCEFSGGLLGIIKEAVGEVGSADLTKVEETLSKILEILNTFKTEGIKKGGTGTSEKTTDTTKPTQGLKKLYLKQGESLKDKMETMALKEHGILGKRGGKLTNPKYKYDFLGFDGNTLTYQLTDIEGKVRQVTMVWDELTKQVSITSDKSVAKLDILAGKVEDFGEKFKNAVQMGYLSDDDAVYKAFKDKVEKITTQTTLDGRDKARNEALRAADEVTKKIAQNKKLYTGTTEMNAATRQYNNLEASGILDQADVKMVEEYKAKYAEIAKIQDEWRSKDKGKGLLNPEAQKQLREASLEAKNLGKELEKAVNNNQRLEQLMNGSGTHLGQNIGERFRLEDNTNMYDAMIARLKELGAEHIKVDRVRQTATGTIRHNSKTVSDLTVEYDKLNNSLVRYQKQERESLTGLPAFLNGFQKKFNSIMQYLTMTMSIHQVIAQLRKGVQYVKEIDLALTELRKVTDETEETYDKFLRTAAKTGERLGATISAVTEATATFAKLGYTMSQATEMAEAAIVYKNVGDNIASTEDAADSIISTMKGFGLEATESMAIVDKFNEVGE